MIESITLPLTRMPPISVLALSACVMLATLSPVSVAQSATPGNGTTWNPVASERLIKLPGDYLRKAIDNDFAGSGLAASLRDVEGRISLKTQTLVDLQAAAEQSEGDLQIELRHQFLAEKREYLELVGRHQDLRRQQMVTKMRLYEKLITKIDRDKAYQTPEQQALINKQQEARQRLERSISQVDLKVFNTPMLTQSKYARDYAKNVIAIERLVQAVNAHPMSAESQLNGRPVTKKEYLRQMVSETQAELQVIDQEETILGYMAKLIALDALALSDLLAEGEPDYADSGVDDDEVGLASAVDFFVAN